MPNERILVADDDPDIRSLIIQQFERESWEVRGAANLQQIRAAVDVWHPDLVVLDLNLPDGDGLALCRELRGEGRELAIIMISARTSAIDRVLGLELGADDYLTKPFEPRELVVRVRNLLRRHAGAVAAKRYRIARFGPWTLDLLHRRLIQPDGTLVILSAAEFRILHRFLQSPGQALSKETLLPERSATVAFDRSLDVRISRLRQKLAMLADGAGLILTARNEGYVLAAEVVFE